MSEGSPSHDDYHLPSIVGTSQSEPHINHLYEKIAVLMYVCVCVSQYVVHVLNTHVCVRKLIW